MEHGGRPGDTNRLPTPVGAHGRHPETRTVHNLGFTCSLSENFTVLFSYGQCC